MDEREMEQLLEEYDDLCGDVEESLHSNFEGNVRRWLHFLDANPALSRVVRRLETGIDFDAWYEEAKGTKTGAVGSGTIEFPTETEPRLGYQVALFRAFAGGRTSVDDYCIDFMFVGTRYDDMVREMNNQIFRPMARDLRRLLHRELEEMVESGEDVPASDRYVTVDHNRPDVQEAVRMLEAVIEAVRQNNGYAANDPEDHEQRLTELEAGRTLFRSVRVRVAAISAVVLPPLTYLAWKFTDAAIGGLAGQALTAIRTALGI